QALTAYPDDVRGDVVVLGEDQARRRDRPSGPGLPAPSVEHERAFVRRELMVPTRLLRHAEFSVDDLVTLQFVVRHRRKVGGGEAKNVGHGAVPLSGRSSWRQCITRAAAELRPGPP